MSALQLHITEKTFRRLALRGVNLHDDAAVIDAFAVLAVEDHELEQRQPEAGEVRYAPR